MVTRSVSDEEILQRVLDELRWDPQVEPTDVGVEVDDGVVTLTGTVESFPMKYAAENAARRVVGVKAVANDIQVRLPQEQARTDTDIAKAAADALEWNTQVPHERIKVVVRDGWVTLEGDVDWHFQREAAERSVRDLMGVKGVTNLITVSAPRVSPTEVKSNIEKALERSARLDAGRIQVEARDGKVILSGTVRSWVEREEAEDAAWATEGVSDVENRITIAP